MQGPNDTATETGRDDNDVVESADQWAPTEEWIKQFQKQCTAKMILGLNQYARTRALTVAAAGRKVDDYYARELVQDALGDTWMGVIRWDPSKCSLGYHLATTLDGRADKHRKHAEKHPHYAIGDYDHAPSRAAERDASELVGVADLPAKRVYADQTLAEIRKLAARDKPILRILDAYAAGCETRDEVLAHARMQEHTYKNAYGRMKRIIEHIKNSELAAKARA